MNQIQERSREQAARREAHRQGLQLTKQRRRKLRPVGGWTLRRHGRTVARDLTLVEVESYLRGDA